MEKYQLYIDGRFVDAESGECRPTLNPATEEPIANVPVASRADARRAVEAARRSFDSGVWSGMDAREQIRLAAGAEEVGLAVMLGDLIRQNLEQRPGKWADFARLDTLICLEARDADVAVTLAFARGTLVIHGGCAAAVIRISATAEALLRLPVVRIVAGLPFPFGREGRGLRRWLLTGRVKIAGLLVRPVQLIRFTRLLSVSE